MYVLLGVYRMNDDLVKFVEKKIQETSDEREIESLEEVLLVFKTSRTVQKSLVNKIKHIEAEIISLKQTELMMDQLTKTVKKAMKEDDYPQHEDPAAYIKFQEEKKSDLMKELFINYEKLKVYRWGVAVANLNEDTKGTFVEVELGDDDV